MKKVILASIESADNKKYRKGGLSLNQYMKKYDMQSDLNGLRCYYRDEVEHDEYPTFAHWMKARRVEQDNLVQFEIGRTYSCSSLYGGVVSYKVVDRTATTITLAESHVSEDNWNKVEDGVIEYPIIIQKLYDESYDNIIGKQESVCVWDYRGHKGYLYAGGQ